MKYFELINQVEKHVAEAGKTKTTSFDTDAIVQALLALTHATMAVAARTSGGHCENCCQD